MLPSRNTVTDKQIIDNEKTLNGTPTDEQNLSDESSDKNILICSERLKELELLEKKLPTIISEAIAEHQRNKLRILHERDKQNPQSVNLRVKRYNERHKEEINAKRRNKRREEKAKRMLLEPKPVSVIASLALSSNNILPPSASAIKKMSNKKNGIENLIQEKPKTADNRTTSSPSPTLEEVLTVRFDI